MGSEFSHWEFISDFYLMPLISLCIPLQKIKLSSFVRVGKSGHVRMEEWSEDLRSLTAPYKHKIQPIFLFSHLTHQPSAPYSYILRSMFSSWFLPYWDPVL